MAQWLLILGAALIGGTLVLHSFGKAKSANERVLTIYRDLLDETPRPTSDDDGGHDVAGKQPAPDADETASPP